MKKLSTYFSAVLCVLALALGLTACGGSKNSWLLPTFEIEGTNYTVEHVTNEEEDFEFPLDGVKLDHAIFKSEGVLEYAWVIYNGSREIVGWIDMPGGYESDKKGKYHYGFSTYTDNGVYGYFTPYVTLILKSSDLAVFENVEVTSDSGPVSTEDNPPFKAIDKYGNYDMMTGEIIAPANVDDFVCRSYTIDLTNVDPKTATSLTITLDLDGAQIG